MSKELAKTGGTTRSASVFRADTYDQMLSMAEMLCKSDLLPMEYRGVSRLPNVMVALDIASRINQPPLTVMENLDNIKGRRSFSSKFLIAQARMAGYTIKYKIERPGRVKADYTFKMGDQWKTKTYEIEEITCFAVMTGPDGTQFTGPKVSVSMAVAEGWYSKGGSKWRTMPELMLRYRAASFLIKTELPELAMGMAITEDLVDAVEAETVDTSYEDVTSVVNEVIESVKAEPIKPEPVKKAQKPNPTPKAEPKASEPEPTATKDENEDDDYDLVD